MFTIDRTFPSESWQLWGIREISGSFERNTWKFKEQWVAKHTWYGNGSRVHLSGFWRDWREIHWKLPKKISRTESRFLGALSELDEFLLNPQVQTCSVAVPGTSRKSGPENREPTGDLSLGDPCPEAVFSSHHSCNLNNPEQEETHHSWQSTGGWVRRLLVICHKRSKVIALQAF